LSLIEQDTDDVTFPNWEWREYGCWLSPNSWGAVKPYDTEAVYHWSASPFWGVWPESTDHPVFVFVDTSIGAGTNWVKPDTATIDYVKGTIKVTHSADFDQISIKFEVKQPPLHPDP